MKPPKSPLEAIGLEDPIVEKSRELFDKMDAKATARSPTEEKLVGVEDDDTGGTLDVISNIIP